jgi:PIN domain nuclease of toxin-antitoxin system
VDTHALLWWQARHRRLSRAARAAIERADEVLISAITCWEVGTLVGAGRVRLDRSVTDWFSDLEADRRLRLLPLSPQSALVAYDLQRASFHGDPADRMIYATAVEQNAPLVTKDERIAEFAARASPPVKVVWLAPKRSR